MQLYRDYHEEFYMVMKGMDENKQKYSYMDNIRRDFDYLEFMSLLRSKNQFMLSDIEVVYIDESDFNYHNTVRQLKVQRYVEYLEQYNKIFQFEKDLEKYGKELTKILGNKVRIFGCQFCYGYKLIDLIVLEEYNMEYIENVQKEWLKKEKQ